MQIDVFIANLESATDAANRFGTWLDAKGAAPDFVALHQSVTTLDYGLAAVLPEGMAVHGATSCLGVMGGDGPKTENGAGAFAIWDAKGDYGTALVAFGDDPRAAAAAATADALMVADRPGEAPDLIWISASPGARNLSLLGSRM